MRLRKSLFALPLLATIAGCASVPALGDRPEIAPPTRYTAEQSLAAAPQGQWPADGWWRAMNDPALDALMDEALVQSPDLAVAAARVNAARGLAQQAGAALLPQAGAEASAGGQQQSQNLGVPAQFVPDGIRDVGRIAGTLSFDLDLWGRNRAALAAATSEEQAAQVDADQARLLLTTSIAAAWADLSLLHAQRNVAADAVRVRQATADLTRRRVDNGLDTQGELAQAQSLVPAAQAEVAALDEAIALTRNRLAALAGAGPDRGLAIGQPAAMPMAQGVPASLPVDLIGRRPDIVAARLRTEAAASRIKVARAAFYPNINLSGLIGLQSLGLGQLFDSGSTIVNGGAAISLPLFEGGRLQGQYRGARAQYDEAVARYDAALLQAIREVADATASLTALTQRLDQQRASLAAAENAARIARIRFQGGLANQLTALQADNQVIVARRAVTDLEGRRLQLDVALVRALGGGFSDAGPRLSGARP
ncbi:efflux transporter outer membrane subunit [Sphingomonas sp. FW199]|uniref:efflux transporter outer membrane subunit n=1 Tax=Sphingomonas sp. FW199 TaxID=3400217 RepID=UPI003CFA1159